MDTKLGHLDCWQNLQDVLKRADLHPEVHNVQIIMDASNAAWVKDSVKGLLSNLEKKVYGNILEMKVVSLALTQIKNQCQKQCCHAQFNSSNLRQQAGRNPVSRDKLSCRESLAGATYTKSHYTTDTCQDV